MQAATEWEHQNLNNYFWFHVVCLFFQYKTEKYYYLEMVHLYCRRTKRRRTERDLFMNLCKVCEHLEYPTAVFWDDFKRNWKNFQQDLRRDKSVFFRYSKSVFLKILTIRAWNPPARQQCQIGPFRPYQLYCLAGGFHSMPLQLGFGENRFWISQKHSNSLFASC